MTVDPFAIPAAAWFRRLDDRVERSGRPSLLMLRAFPLRKFPAILGRIMADARRRAQAGWDPQGTLLTGSSLSAPGPYQGAPLGGIGAGTVGRGWRGEFRRWQRRPGFYQQRVAWASQFSLFVQRLGHPGEAQVLFPGRPPGRHLAAWQWNMNSACATYHALYPRAWFTYEQPLPGVRLVCRQLSPVIPHNYRESSYPVGHFLWQITNLGDSQATVGLMFTWQNGWDATLDRGHAVFDRPLAEGERTGGGLRAVGAVMRQLHHQARAYPVGQTSARREEFADPMTFAIAALADEQVTVSTRIGFPAEGEGATVWHDFAQDGRLAGDGRSTFVVDPVAADRGRGARASAVAATVAVPPGATREIAFVLAWDMPLVRSGFGTAYHRRYTRFYGVDGEAASAIAGDALRQAQDWETQIVAWQRPILDDPALPDWYKMALFNELYYIADGGTWWVEGTPPHPERSGSVSLALAGNRAAAEDAPSFLRGREAEGEGEPHGHFAYLEGHEYRMLNTYDVHFYASFALAMLWPQLELSLQRDIAAATLAEYPDTFRAHWSGKLARRKVAGAVPHDVGWPDEDPWRLVNGYPLHDVNRWKDLNPKFVLQVYRDYLATGDMQFVADVWPAVEAAMAYAAQFDRDGDGLIENDGEPDQTYDTWSVRGPSAYTGGLWLASLAAAAALAELMGREQLAAQYRQTLARGQAAFRQKLWNGRYFNYDASRSRQQDSIMADQLAGQWYARACGLAGIVEPTQARSALHMVFAHNVLGFAGGRLGAVNGMRPDGRVDTTSMQSQEVWPGVTYGLAAAMLQEGLAEAAWQTAKGVVMTTYHDRGYWFQTPEAWDRHGNYRAIAYMRPLAIWAMQWALNTQRAPVSSPASDTLHRPHMPPAATVPPAAT